MSTGTKIWSTFFTNAMAPNNSPIFSSGKNFTMEELRAGLAIALNEVKEETARNTPPVGAILNANIPAISITNENITMEKSTWSNLVVFIRSPMNFWNTCLLIIGERTISANALDEQATARRCPIS